MAMNQGKHWMVDEAWLMDLARRSDRMSCRWDDGDAAEAGDSSGSWASEVEAWEHEAVTEGNLGPPLPDHPDDLDTAPTREMDAFRLPH